MRWVPLLLLTACAAVRPAMTGPAWTNAHDAVALNARHTVFVAGFLNEVIPGYFTDNVAVTEALGGTASIVAPPSTQGLDDDVALIERELAQHQGHPVILVGHSKGGATALLTVLRHPELVLLGQVECVVVLQGAVGGSPLADLLSQVGPLRRSAGVQALTTGTARRAMADAVAAFPALTPAEEDFLYSRIFYVRSAHREGVLAAELSLTELILREHGENDGLVNTSEMQFRLGVDLGVLDADHAALTVSSFVSASTADERRQFTRALYAELARRMNW